MRRLAGVVGIVLLLATPALATEQSEVKLRGWFIGLQSASSSRNTYAVFEQPGLPTGDVVDPGEGGGLLFGRRFGDRFLLGLQMVVVRHRVAGTVDDVMDTEALVTGTVLFRETSVLQPFLRGGFGAGAEVMEVGPSNSLVISYGTAAIGGGGLQVRLSSRFSLEFEAIATFANFLEVSDQSDAGMWPDDSWQVRVSNYGWRFGTGVVIWF